MDASDSPAADAPDAAGSAGRSPSPETSPETGPARDREHERDRDPDGMLAEQLLRLTRRLHRIQSRQLEPIGITPAQFRLLRTVASYDAAPGWPISPSAWTSSRAP